VVNDDPERPFAPPPEPDFGRWSRSHVLAVARGDRTDPDCLAEIRRAELAGITDEWLARAVARGDRRWRDAMTERHRLDESELLAAAYKSGAIG
jgi:hypothetical protein